MSNMEIVQAVDDLISRDDALHWFCPRSRVDDYSTCFDEDCLSALESESSSEKEERHRKIKQVKTKLDEIALACKIYAFDGDDAASYWQKFEDKLAIQLTRCDICVREFHRFRAHLKMYLESQYEDDEVHHFLQKYDTWNIDRIGKNLDKAVASLLKLEPQSRSINVLNPEGMYAMFEALNCGPFLLDETALSEHFDKAFQLVQTKKRIKLPSYAPGMAAFLFSRNSERSAWAHRSFAGMKRDLTTSEFEYGVRPFLEKAMSRVAINLLEKDFLPTFWAGILEILGKMTKDLLANNLCAMEQNLYMLALEHFQINADHFRDEVASLAATLELNPRAFWTALGDVNAQSVVDTILRAPKLRALMTITDETERLHLDKYFSWCLPFIRSLKPAHIVPPVRSLLHVLLKDFQTSPCSKYAQGVCWNQGLSVLLEAINLTHQLSGGPVVMHMIELISSTHIHAIVDSLEGIEQKDEQRISEADQMALDIVEKALALDVKALSHDRSTIQKTMTLDHEVKSAAGKIHREAAKCVKPGHPALPAAILAGLVRLVSLEPFTEKQLAAVKTPHAREWNGLLQTLRDMIHEDLLGRLEAFAPEQLVELFQEAKAADGLVALLLNGDQQIHQGALNILKTLTGEDNRRDCLMHITTIFFNTTLDGTAKALTLVSKQSAYTPCLTILKVCLDIFSCLCDSQDGILRSDKKLSSLDLSALKNLWSKTWYILDMIFAHTESWSTLGYPKEDLADFCRATMDFADTTFDQYAIIANRLKDSAKANSAISVGRELLELPKAAFQHISKWLRLRDDYLITRAVGLTSKILVRLQEVDIEIGAEAAIFIEDVVTSTERHAKVKTKLSMSQKAELQRALEKHLQRRIAEVEETVPKKQTTLAAFARSGSSTPVPSADKPRAGTIDVDSWAKVSEKQRLEASKRATVDDTPANEAYKQRMLALRKQPIPTVNKSSIKQQESFLAKRKAEKEAAEKAKAAMLAKQKLGAGTGVEGLGDMGKDHTTKGQNVMVSSSEDESDDDDDDIDVDLFGPAQKEKRKIARPDVDPKGAIGLRPEQKGPTKIRRTARSAKDMRARLAPDLHSLHKTILKWDFFFEGDYPPGSNEHIFRTVNNVYMDSSTYQGTFEPLLTLEAWQGMVRTREEMEKPKIFDVKIQNRSNVDSFIEISSLLSHQENKDLFLTEGDIVLFSKSAKEPHRDQSAPHCLARVYRIKRQKAHLEVVYQMMAGTTLTPALVPQAIIHAIKLQSIIPLEREYGALQGLQYYDLCQQIIRAAPSSKMNFSEKQLSAFQENWNVNRAQSEAINAAMENEGFSLIQGPPGSGKTKTIVAIVGGLLSPILAQGAGSGAVTKISAPRPNMASNDTDGMPKKLLVCAPSNAAVDELVMRLKDGVKTRKGQHCPINIVRIGRSEAINQQVMDVTMEELVNKRLGHSEMDQKTRERNAALFKEHETVSARLRELYSTRDGGEVKGQEMTDLEREISAVRKHKNNLGLRIDNAKDQEKNAGREQELNRKRAQQAILDQAHVICATLSGSGHDMFRTLNVEFETVIIDEAAQCVEMSSLIPLKYGCVKCIMVGDPKQLPPTVFSREAAKFQYEQSLFVRMQNNFPKGVYLLDTQYRMHPDISVFPSHTFYDDRLKDGADMAALRQRPWHRSTLLAPYRFFDVQGQHQKARIGGSLTNKTEVEVAMALYERLRKDFGDYDFGGRIGIITPYKSQLRMLKSEFVTRYGSEIFETIEFNTTDAFQGRESEVIIFSCVRASPAGGIGFLRDIRRMNVGLTRAKSSLWVLGHSESLQRGRYWKELIDDAKARDRFTSGDVTSMLRKPSSAYPATERSVANMRDVDRATHKPNGVKASAMIKKAVIQQEEKKPDPKPSPPPPTKPTAIKEETTGRMEGITYRFQDRIAGKKPSPPVPAPDSDVDMNDAPSENGAARETPESQSGRSTPQQQQADRQQAPKATAPIIRKRPAANPFMPAKKKFSAVRKQ